jgi:hypothetical protein
MDFRLIDKSSVHHNLLRFAVYCETLANGAEMAQQSLFEARNTPWLFGFIAVVDVLEGGADYRYAYAGDFWKAMLGYDINATRVSELEACGRFPNVRSNYDAAVRARSPRYRTARLSWPDGKVFRYERLVVPFAGDDGAVAMLVVAAQCEKPLSDLLAYRGLGEAKLTLELSKQIK